MQKQGSEKDFIMSIEKTAENTIKKYGLFSMKDRITVACSGGKDSTSLLYMLSKSGYNVSAVFADLSIGAYSSRNRKNISRFCGQNRIELDVVSIKDYAGMGLAEIVKKAKFPGNEMPYCRVCGILKRYVLNSRARETGASCIATGHNLDDEAQTILMNILKGSTGLCAGMGPVTGVCVDKRFVRRVKPLYFCAEKDIEKYSRLMEFPVVYSICPLSRDVYRRAIKNELDALEKKLPGTKMRIVSNFLEILPLVRENARGSSEIGSCSICGEPSRSHECSFCRIIARISKGLPGKEMQV